MSAIPYLNRSLIPAVPVLSLYGMGVLLLVLFSTLKQIWTARSRSPGQAGNQGSQLNAAVAIEETDDDEAADKSADAVGLLAAATYRGRKTHNEDSYFYGDFGAFKALVVADGVSSSQYAKTASYTLIQTLHKALCAMSEQDTMLPDRQTIMEACEQAARQIACQLPANSLAQSTLVVLLEFPERFLLLYLGDGGVVRVRGNGRDGKSLLLAHHDESGLLSGFVGATGPSLSSLSMLEFSKSPLADGDIVFVGTDGALPPRQEVRHAAVLLDKLFVRGKELGRALTAAEIHHEIASYLKICEPHDNATLGILFSTEAVSYWRQQLNLQPNQRGVSTDGKKKGAVIDTTQHNLRSAH